MVSDTIPLVILPLAMEITDAPGWVSARSSVIVQAALVADGQEILRETSLVPSWFTSVAESVARRIVP